MAEPVQTVPVTDLSEGDAILWEDNVAEILEIDPQPLLWTLTVKVHYGRHELKLLPVENVQRLVTTDGF